MTVIHHGKQIYKQRHKTEEKVVVTIYEFSTYRKRNNEQIEENREKKTTIQIFQLDYNLKQVESMSVSRVRAECQPSVSQV